MTAPYPTTPTLVVLVNNHDDWRRVTEEGWYRIPLKRAPTPAAAGFLAFYQSRIFGTDAFHIRYYAPVHRYQLLSRRELLPDEPNHPRADEQYYRVMLGPLQELDYPIPSRHLRRITFIPTTLQRLLEADEINDLWLHDDAEDLLWELFRDAGLKAERRLEIGERHERYVVPMVVHAPDGDGGLAIFCDREPRPPSIGPWRCLTIAPREVYAAPERCLAQVRALLARI